MFQIQLSAASKLEWRKHACAEGESYSLELRVVSLRQSFVVATIEHEPEYIAAEVDMLGRTFLAKGEYLANDDAARVWVMKRVLKILHELGTDAKWAARVCDSLESQARHLLGEEEMPI